MLCGQQVEGAIQAVQRTQACGWKINTLTSVSSCY